jgi:hypothetical protein
MLVGTGAVRAQALEPAFAEPDNLRVDPRVPRLGFFARELNLLLAEAIATAPAVRSPKKNAPHCGASFAVDDRSISASSN